MNANGMVKARQPIGSGDGGGPTLANGDYFGHSVAAVGDLDGDSITDLAVGASKDDTGGYINGAVYVLFMSTDGTARRTQKIASRFGGGPALATGDRFGSSLATLGDLDGDGIGDLAVGAISDDTGGNYRGAVHVLFMHTNGTVKSSQKIASGIGGGPVLADGDVFGISIAPVGDFDGDGVSDLTVGAMFDDTGGPGRGAVYLLLMNSNGTAKSSRKIAGGTAGGPALSDGDYFGRSVASPSDLDGDGVTDLVVGAYRDDTGGSNRGALYVLFLNADGTVKRSQKIASNTGGGPALADHDRFGSGAAAIGDLNGDGVIELAVGAEMDSTGGSGRGAVHVLFLKPAAPIFVSGDYNSNGTVDVIDFVVWRKTLGQNVPPFSGADGNGNGVIDQADYDIWRANFGRTAPVSATTSALAAALVEPVNDDASAAGLSESFDDSHARGPVRRLASAGPDTETARQRTSRIRPAMRNTVPQNNSYDDALVAWLASRSMAARPTPPAATFANSASKITLQYIELSLVELDLAFAAV